ncbi:hypothetical protein [Thermopirellula anaerolimosa]
MFLAAYANNANVAAAARAAGISRTDHYRWLRDSDYRRRFLDARESALDGLEEEAWKRARDGSDRLLMYLLSAYRPRFRADAPPPAGPLDPELVELDEQDLIREAQREAAAMGYGSLDDVWADG